MIAALLLGCAGAGPEPSPPDPVRHLAVGGYHACLLEDGAPTCQFLDAWSGDYGQASSPAGRWKSLTLGSLTSCGLREDGTVECWGWNQSGQSEAPSGTFTELSVNYEHACGLRADGTMACWGANYAGETDPHPGTFVDVATFGNDSCGLLADGSLACWGWYPDHGAMRDLAAPLGSIDGGGTNVCGLDAEGRILCIGGSDEASSSRRKASCARPRQ